jgi:hypothetical protein
MPGLVVGTDGNGNPVYATSVSYGSAYLLRADIQNSQGKFCNPLALGAPPPFIACPTGSVTVTDNGNPLDAGTFKLNSLGYTEDPVIQLASGSHALLANYGGDSSFNASNHSQAITITKATTGINNVSAPTSATPGQGFNVTATVSTVSSGVAPSGTVSFFANSTLLPGTVQYTPINGTSSNNASLGASLVTSINTPGNYSITATYSGDPNYANVAQSNADTIVIFDFNVPGTLTAPVSPAPGQSTTTNMTISPVGGGTFTSSVTFHCTPGSLPVGVTCSFLPTQIAAGSPATSVQITVATAGPFTGIAGGAARHKLLGQKQHPWLPLGLPLAGMVLFGFAGRKLPRHHKVVGLCLSLAFMGFLVACGGGGSSSPPPPPPISVSVNPSMVNTLYPNLTGAPLQAQQFTATVHNSSNQAVNWQVNGTAGGNATFGTIDTSGNYTAPVTMPNPSTFNVTAVAQADASKSGNASVAIQTPTPSGLHQIIVLVDEGAVEHQTTFNLTVQ